MWTPHQLAYLRVLSGVLAPSQSKTQRQTAKQLQSKAQQQLEKRHVSLHNTEPRRCNLVLVFPGPSCTSQEGGCVFGIQMQINACICICMPYHVFKRICLRMNVNKSDAYILHEKRHGWQIHTRRRRTHRGLRV